MTEPQNLEALRNANHVKNSRAALKRALKAGEVTLPEILLADIPDYLEKMRVEELCLAAPRVGRYRVSPALAQVPTHPHSHVGFLTMRQRTVLAELAEGWPAAKQEAVAA